MGRTSSRIVLLTRHCDPSGLFLVPFLFQIPPLFASSVCSQRVKIIYSVLLSGGFIKM
jgi:hypothetical protein